MSHDQGLTWPRNTHSSQPQAQPALDRPSLFAGMEADADEAPERVRILSTLAASRPPSKRASTRSRRGSGHSWQFKSLLALMGLGIVGLLVGFAMVLAQGHSQAGTAVSPEAARRALIAAPAATPVPAKATTIATTAASVTASAATANLPSTQAPQTAVIEEVAPDVVAGVGTLASASPLAALGSTSPTTSTLAKSAPAPAPAPTSASRPTALPQTPARSPTTAGAQTEPRRVAQTTPPSVRTEARPRQTATKRGQDADVALLEAMFTHTRSARSARSARTDGDKRRLCAQQPQNAACTKAR